LFADETVTRRTTDDERRTTVNRVRQSMGRL
jgi:hypothetical protein